MRSLQDIHLILFMTRAVPLSRWDEMGIFERETAIYRKLSEKVGKMSIVTYGDERELGYQNALGNIEILYNRWGISNNAYSVLAPWLHRKALQQATLFKSNQPDGSWAPLIASKLWGKPMIARAGYLWAQFHRNEGNGGLKATAIDQLQKAVFKNATHIALTTNDMRQDVSKIYGINDAKISVIPNYVNTDTFCPNSDIVPQPGRICFTGRLHPRKNLHLLIEAAAGIDGLTIQLIGNGEQESELRQLADKYQVNVEFSGVLPQTEIPSQIQRAELFALVSQFEGHPKSLIEALACGAVVLGSRTPGIREFIDHGTDGWLCEPTVYGIRTALLELLTQKDKLPHIRQHARKTALDQFSLDHIISLECDMYLSVVNRYYT